MPKLRPLDPERDGKALHAIFGDEECCRYMTKPANASVEETIRDLKKWTTGLEDTSWAIVEEPDGEALGRVALFSGGQPDVWEVGIMIVPSAQGKGLATGALAQAIDIAFDRLGARRIYADIDPDNTASLRAFEKLGFQREGLLRAAWDTHIGIRDSVIMGLLPGDPRPWKP